MRNVYDKMKLTENQFLIEKYLNIVDILNNRLIIII